MVLSEHPPAQAKPASRAPRPVRAGVEWWFTPLLPESSLRMKQLIALSAIGSDRTGMVHDLTRVIADCGGNIVESRMSALGSEFVMGLLISGNWHSLAKIETEIKKLGDGGEISVLARRTEQRAVRADMLPYS